MSTKTADLLILGAMVFFLSAAPASATGPYFYNYGCGAWGGYYPPSRYYPERLPYCALYPPVYYSQPVPRPYGYSPFAYPPGVLTPEPAARATSRPLVIGNPYMAPAEEIAPPAPPEPLAPAPKIVYPAQQK